jgi:hypothetical protein
VAALFQISRLEAADPNAGSGLELQVIAAVVIGGTSLMGGPWFGDQHILWGADYFGIGRRVWRRSARQSRPSVSLPVLSL